MFIHPTRKAAVNAFENVDVLMVPLYDFRTIVQIEGGRRIIVHDTAMSLSFLSKNEGLQEA
jgi:hypothetical protein